MHIGKGKMLKKVIVETCGRTEDEFFCYYEYKDECEPEENKRKYPNPKDRGYETYMDLLTITEARKHGAEVDIETYQSDRIEWNEEHQQYAVKKEVFNDEKWYYAQFQKKK